MPCGTEYISASSPLAETIDGVPQMGGVTSSEVDDSDGDYVLDAYGNETAWDDTMQRVYLLLKNSYGSIKADPEIGLRKPQKLGPNVTKQVDSYVRQALLPVTSDGSVAIESIETVVENGRLFALVNWRSLKTWKPQNIKYPIG
jgi:hypothetical protein